MSTESDLDLAVRLAKEAGQLLLSIRRDAGPIESDDKAALKALRDHADATANDLILAGLRRARPGDGILSEEEKDNEARLSASRVWIVDPLDGTWEYGQGRRDFGVHIALYEPSGNAMPVGVVDLPEQGLTRTSGDKSTDLPPIPTGRPLRVVASRTRPPAGLGAIVERWAQRAGREVEIVNVGSVGAKVNEILLGNVDAYLHDTGFFEWDLAAPLAVAQRFGLAITHFDGTEITFNHLPPFVENVFVARREVAAQLRASL